MVKFIIGVFVGELLAAFLFAMFGANHKKKRPKKQQPRRIIEKTSDMYHNVIFYNCPNCGYTVNGKTKNAKCLDFAKAPYCCKCGQALDWGANNG